MRHRLLVVLSAVAATSVGASAQTVPGYTVEDYASVPDPLTRSFMPDGTMFVGRATDQGEAGKIHRVAPGGMDVVEWGNDPINDPDAVLADPSGLFAPAGSVLVGGANPGLGGSIRAILPDQSIIDVFPPDLAVVNPNGLKFDLDNRLLVGDDRSTNTRIWVSDGGPLTTLIDLPGFGGTAVEPGTNNIYANVGGTVSIYDENGGLLDGDFATLPAGGGITFGPGNALWGDDLYAMIESTGELIRVDDLGNPTVIGTGFAATTYGPSFGPDGFMYFSVENQDKIIRVVPEPATLSLLALGGLALVRRRR